MERGCCQSVSTCCSEASWSTPARLVNMALADAPTSLCTRKNSPRTKAKRARTAFATKNTVANTAKPSDYNSACKGIHGSQVRLGQKNVPHSPRVSGEQIRGIPNICVDLPCLNRRRVAVGSSAVDGVFYFDAFSPPSSCYCRSALTSRPCHGSMLVFLFPASRDRIAAQLRGTGPVRAR